MTRWLRVLIVCACIVVMLASGVIAYSLWYIRVQEQHRACIAANQALATNIEAVRAQALQHASPAISDQAFGTFLEQVDRSIADCYRGRTTPVPNLSPTSG